MLALAAASFRGELLAMIDPANARSKNVAGKLGSAFWKQVVLDGDPVDMYRLSVGVKVRDKG